MTYLDSWCVQDLLPVQTLALISPRRASIVLGRNEYVFLLTHAPMRLKHHRDQVFASIEMRLRAGEHTASRPFFGAKEPFRHASMRR